MRPATHAKNALRRPYHLARRSAKVALLPYRLARPRRLEISGCGLSKSGTHSLAGIFEGYRSAHHPDETYRIRLAMAYLRGEVDDPTAEAMLKRRDRLLRFEVESSSLAGILVRPLARAFPSRRFILTIRDVFSWCDSWFDHNINHPADESSPWSILDRVRLGADSASPTRFDAPLTERGFPPLECFCRLWADHNGRVLETVEAHRLLVVRTHEITEKIPEIAAWVGVPAQSLRSDRSWLFSAERKHHLLSALDTSYVHETVDRFCSTLMRVHFPELSWEPQRAR